MRKLLISVMLTLPIALLGQYTTTTNGGGNPAVNLNAASGSATYVINPSPTQECGAYTVSRAYRIGDGSGRVELCVTNLARLFSNCGGGNNKDSRLWVWTDQNADGTPDALYGYWDNAGFQINALGPSFTDCQNCVMSPAGSNYLWVDFCGDGGCSSADYGTIGVDFTWNSFVRSANDDIGAAEPIDTCSVAFTADNYDATPGACGGYQVNWNNNLDCNTGTALSPNGAPTNTNGGAGGGGDVGYSVESDIWFTFNPGVIGTWTLTFTPSNCYASNGISSGGDACDFYTNGFQYALFEGTSATNFTSIVAGGTNGMNLNTAQVIPINVTTTATTYYLQIEGYGGVGCTFDALLTPPAGVCTLLPLPIQLLSFGAEVNEENKVDLNWQTAAELNNEFFTIERTQDGEVFEVIGIVDGAGNSTMVKNYDLIDDEPHTGTSYYRLKQTDYNGSYTYSDMVAVYIEVPISDVKVYPNPVKGNGQVYFNSAEPSYVDIVILDVAGRIVLNKAYGASKGANNVDLNTEVLGQGMYFVSINSGSSKTTVKFIKD